MLVIAFLKTYSYLDTGAVGVNAERRGFTTWRAIIGADDAVCALRVLLDAEAFNTGDIDWGNPSAEGKDKFFIMCASHFCTDSSAFNVWEKVTSLNSFGRQFFNASRALSGINRRLEKDGKRND